MYNSAYDTEIDECIESEINNYLTEKGIELEYDDFDIDMDGYKKVLAYGYVSEFENYMPTNIIKEVKKDTADMWSPSAYNYSTDKVYVEIVLADDWKEQIMKFINENYDTIKARIKKDWSSYDGFWSFIENDIDTFVEKLDEDERYIEVIIAYIMEYTHGKDVFETMNSNNWEDCSAYEYIHLSESGEKMTLNVAENKKYKGKKLLKESTETLSLAQIETEALVKKLNKRADIQWVTPTYAVDEESGCNIYIFDSEEDAYDYIVSGDGNQNAIDYVESAQTDEDWIKYLINGGVDAEEATDVITNQDWQRVVEIIIDAEGPEWFLSSYSGYCYHIETGKTIYY